MFRANTIQPGRVTLVESTDSVSVRDVTASPSLSTASTATLTYSSFVPPTSMAKQPVRVLARPPPPTGRGGLPPPAPPPRHPAYALPPHPPSVIVQPGAARSYNELVEMAEGRRRQIEANRREEERRQALLGRGMHLPPSHLAHQLRDKRREVAVEELELKRLSELERETRSLRVRNEDTGRAVEMLARTCEEEQMQLRRAASKVDSLRAQLEELHRRRRAAANAALVEQKRMATAQAHSAQMQAMRATASATPTLSSHHENQRPRASVEPFQIQHTKPSEELHAMKEICTGDNETDSRLRHPPVPSGTVTAPSSGFKVRLSDFSSSASSSHQTTTMVTSSSTTSDSSAKREDISPSPPKDPHPTASLAVGEQPLPSTEDEAHPRLRGGKTDLVSLRPDSLKATKRRSWAASDHTTFGEADVIRRTLLEEQMKGHSRYIPELATIAAEVTEMKEEEPVAAIQKEPEMPAPQSIDIVVPEPSEIFCPAPVARPSTIGGVEKPTEETSSSSAEESASLCSTRSSEGTVEMEVVPPKAVKGILRNKDTPSKNRRIEFDPLALLLDAALEGEVDLVKESASKLSDVSASNDEGITALHNAICAGHYEIVRFLIEENADVNAQDSDGWTPLHCAASCNNLPMVRVLVEGGACVLASTLSDLETPVEKCEEEEEGYDGCSKFLRQAHTATGTLNNGLVYAAYPYGSERDDELSFDGGDEITVLDKVADGNSGWWMCEKTLADGRKARGLAPRTYLALYPPIKYRKRLGFIPFDLITESNNNDK